ncbi:hypothetical protein EDB84DRAFT_1278534, partial [Lactarius hengduanensis]
LILPDLEPDAPSLPRGAVDLGGGYVLLRARDETGVILVGEQADTIRAFLCSDTDEGQVPLDWQPKYIRWARLRLPNMQIARCAWKEVARARSTESVRRSRNVKFSTMESFLIGEVQFYFRSDHSGVERAYALVSVWSEPDKELLEESSKTVYSCAYQGQAVLRVVDVKFIESVVAMVPMTPCEGDRSARYFLLEKPGLDVAEVEDVLDD